MAGPPSGATAPHVATPATTTTTAAPASTRRSVWDPSRREPWARSSVTRAATVVARIPRPPPPSQTRPTSSSGPPTRAAPARGPEAWPRARPPMGRPAEGPCRPQRLGEHHGAGQRRGASPGPARDHGARQCRRQGLHRHEDETPVGVERRHPPQPGDEHPESHDPPGEQPSPHAEAAEPPPHEARGREGEDPEAPGRERQRQGHTGRQGRDHNSTASAGRVPSAGVGAPRSPVPWRSPGDGWDHGGAPRAPPRRRLDRWRCRPGCPRRDTPPRPGPVPASGPRPPRWPTLVGGARRRTGGRRRSIGSRSPRSAGSAVRAWGRAREGPGPRCSSSAMRVGRSSPNLPVEARSSTSPGRCRSGHFELSHVHAVVKHPEVAGTRKPVPSRGWSTLSSGNRSVTSVTSA